ncbi:MAG: glycerophosphodiester phosphodiesterase family protein [Candidatus Promineifilaceae bacterium]|nr:glycerophosphodiester phosphodiesterase family protein [Candidatus Promineifilaceae bacterium]
MNAAAGHNAWLTAPDPLLIGHRGASAQAPENTLAAFALAGQQGAHGVELDLRLAADGVPVVIHDATVDRTTNGSGAVADLTAAQLQRLNAGAGQPVPTLDDLFAAFGSTYLYNLELKGRAWQAGRLLSAVAESVHRHALARRVLVSSFSPWIMWRSRRYFPPQVALALLVAADPLSQQTRRLFHGAAEHPQAALVDQAYMDRARARGLRVHVWTVNDPSLARTLLDLGVHALISDDPQRLRPLLNELS